MVEHLLCFRCKCLRVLHVSLYCTHTHTHLCVSMVPSSLSCHFTASQVSPKQTDASPPTSPLFAAHSIIGHTHTHTRKWHAQLWSVPYSKQKYSVAVTRPCICAHTYTKCLTQLQACWRKWLSQLLLTNYSNPQHTPTPTHSHTHSLFHFPLQFNPFFSPIHYVLYWREYWKIIVTLVCCHINQMMSTKVHKRKCHVILSLNFMNWAYTCFIWV